ncbi:MAG: hypothetical protein ACREOC_15555 [Gemmatimonadales bacterium]
MTRPVSHLVTAQASPLSHLSLVELYRCLLGGSQPAALVERHIRHRSALAGALLRPWATELSEQDLQEFQDRLHAVAEPNPRMDPAVDAAERELARVHCTVVEQELSGREQLAELVDQRASFAMGRNDLVGYLFDAARQLRDLQQGTAPAVPTTAPVVALFDQLVGAVGGALETQPPGRLVVAQALRAAAHLSHPRDDEGDPWVRSAIVLELLTQEGGWMGVALPVDAVTRAQAVRAKRIFYAEVRQDPRYDELRWPLDLTGVEIAELLAGAEHASATWVRDRMPAADLEQYLEPIRREEPGRPMPHHTILPERAARALALERGASTSPMVLFVPPSERVETARRVWESGPPAIEPGTLGIPVYSLGGDPRVRWGAVTFPHGLLCVVDLAAGAILHLGRKDSAEQEAKFEAMVAQATKHAETEAEYATRLREILLERGVKAIARYDHVAKQLNKPQEVILLEPETSLKFIRETVPSFVRGYHPVYLLPHE